MGPHTGKGYAAGSLAQPESVIHLMRETQNASDYLQADETRIQVLKENGKSAQSDKWMWVIRGGPPDQPSVLFAYDPSRAGSVPVRLLDDFQGILQADGYSGYGQICRANGITRIGCWPLIVTMDRLDGQQLLTLHITGKHVP